MFSSFSRKLAACATGMALAVSLAACASSDSDSATGSTSDGGASAAASVKEAGATVAELTNPAEFTVDPVKGDIPTGKVVAQVNCTIPQCSPGVMQKPVEALGWTFEGFDYDVTKGAQDYVRAVNAALDSHPDYLALGLNFGHALVEKQLERAKAEGITVIGFAGSDDLTGLAASIQSSRALLAGGEYMADAALADAGEPIQVGVAVDTQQEGIMNLAKGVAQRLDEVPGASAGNIELSFAQPQATNVSAIVNYLKSNPDTDYVVFPGTAFFAGVKQGVQAAGLGDKVKFILGYPQATDMQAVKDGEFAATISGENFAVMWRVVDAMARLAAGDSLTDKLPVGSFRAVTEENAGPSGTDPAGYEAAFLGAWGV